MLLSLVGVPASSVYPACAQTAKEFGAPGNYVLGANIIGFLKVAKAMVAQGFLA